MPHGAVSALADQKTHKKLSAAEVVNRNAEPVPVEARPFEVGPADHCLQVPRALLNGDLGGVALTDLSRVQPLWSGQLDMR
jgi:hypothetical protein